MKWVDDMVTQAMGHRFYIVFWTCWLLSYHFLAVRRDRKRPARPSNVTIHVYPSPRQDARQVAAEVQKLARHG